MVTFVLDDWGVETRPGDYVLHHLPSCEPGKDMICSLVLDLHGKQTIEVDLQQRNYVKGTGIVWKNFTTNRFIKVDEAFAKEHYDFNHTKGSYNTSDSYHRCEIN